MKKILGLLALGALSLASVATAQTRITVQTSDHPVRISITSYQLANTTNADGDQVTQTGTQTDNTDVPANVTRTITLSNDRSLTGMVVLPIPASTTPAPTNSGGDGSLPARTRTR